MKEEGSFVNQRIQYIAALLQLYCRQKQKIIAKISHTLWGHCKSENWQKNPYEHVFNFQTLWLTHCVSHPPYGSKRTRRHSKCNHHISSFNGSYQRIPNNVYSSGTEEPVKLLLIFQQNDFEFPFQADAGASFCIINNNSSVVLRFPILKRLTGNNQR